MKGRGSCSNQNDNTFSESMCGTTDATGRGATTVLDSSFPITYYITFIDMHTSEKVIRSQFAMALISNCNTSNGIDK